MKRLVRTLVPAVAALTGAVLFAHAQTAPAPAQQSGDPAMHNHRPSAETMQRMQDGKFAMIKGALKLTDAQQKLWQPVEDLMRGQQAARAKGMQDQAAKRDANAQRPSLADRLDRESTELAARAERTKTFAATFRPFYDSLSEEQKAVAGPLMAQLSGGHHMHGRHFAARDQH